MQKSNKDKDKDRDAVCRDCMSYGGDYEINRDGCVVRICRGCPFNPRNEAMPVSKRKD